MSDRHTYNEIVTQYPSRAEAVTPSDATTFAQASTVYVGTAGAVVVEPEHGSNTVSFQMQAGSVVPVMVRRVLATGTTAGSLVRIFS